MPRKVVAASGVLIGGVGKRRSDEALTKSGRARNAPRWTTTAAIAARRLLMHTAEQWKCTYTSCIKQCIESKEKRVLMMSSTVATKIPIEEHVLISEILDGHAAALMLPGSATAQSKAEHIRQYIRSHAGPNVQEEVEAPEQVALEERQEGGWWLDRDSDQPMGAQREQPPVEGRQQTGLKHWGIERLGVLPEHAVVCFERAEGRANNERQKYHASKGAEPSMKLLRALVHVDSIPTAVGSASDHYWLPALGRWMSITEMMRLFGVPETSSLWYTLTTQVDGLTAVQIGSALGRAVHVDCVEQALCIIDEWGGLPERLRYASSCSGLDLFAVAVEARWHRNWRYVQAAECKVGVALTLLETYWDLGLQGSYDAPDDNILMDACDEDRAAPACDLWTWSPPCEKFSRRNHVRTAEDRLEASRVMQQMLWYPKMVRPSYIIVENVDEKEAMTAVTGALACLEGYDWKSFRSDGVEATRMHRPRRYWVGKRVL
jgi:hypothetical protein